MISKVPTKGDWTIYAMIGDLFAWLCLSGFAAMIWKSIFLKGGTHNICFAKADKMIGGHSLNWSLVFLLVWISLPPRSGLAQETRLISFELEDQFGGEYTENSWQDSILIILGSDEDGAQYNPIWATAIFDTLKKELPGLPVKGVGLADVSGVPFFLTGIVRGSFPDDPAKWVLMDWDGIFPESYDFAEEHCNILVFDVGRFLIHQTAVRELEEEKLGAIVRKIKESTFESDKEGMSHSQEIHRLEELEEENRRL